MDPDLKLIVLVFMTCLFLTNTQGHTKTGETHETDERKDEGKSN